MILEYLHYTASSAV